MSHRMPRRIALAAAGAAALLAAAAAPPEKLITRTDDVSDVIHGVKVADPYRWLENGETSEVREWTERQNAVTRGALDKFGAAREALAARLEKLNDVASSSSPQVFDKRYFYTRREGLKNHPILYLREGGMDKEPKVVLDPNTFSEDGTVALDWWFPSPDGAYVAYGKSASGSEKSTLYIRDVNNSATAALSIPNTRACTVAWSKSGEGFTYVRYPEKGSVPDGDEVYYRHVYYHKFGTKWKDDRKIFGDDRPKEEWHDVSNSTDYRYQFMTASLDWAKNDLYIRKPDEADFRPVAVGLNGKFSAEMLGDKLVLLTDYEAPRYRVLVTDPANPAPSEWKELIPQQEGVIQTMNVINGKLVLTMMENVCSRVLIYGADGKLADEVKLPTLGSVSGVEGRHDANELYFSFQSFVYPPTVFRYDLEKHDLKTIDKMDVDVNPADFETRQVWFKSKDGTKVPMFVLHKKDIKLDGSNPAILYGYGGFDISMTPTFSQGIFPWLESGGVYAVANLRGGGEFGRDWHVAGRGDKKQNVFDDMIAAGEKLVADKYTRPERLGARGGSNGGLLMGAMMTQRPDLFRAIVCQVPLLDMIRYHNFSIARLWIPEYGSAEDAAQFKTLMAYSPYHHVKKGEKYPGVLFITAESDSRVDPMHARKMAAAMQAANASDRPILLWVETKAGHGAGKPLKKVIESQVDYWVFFMWQLGMLDGAA